MLLSTPQQVPSQIQNPGMTRLKWIVVWIAAIIAIIAAVGVVLPALQTSPRCPPTEMVSILQATFGTTAGQVTFAISNSGTVPITILQVLAQGNGITGTTSVTISNNNTAQPGDTLSLTVTFPGVTFQSVARYDFIMVSACGNRVPSYGIA